MLRFERCGPRLRALALACVLSPSPGWSAAGGPDEGGYAFSDSAEAGGPVFEYVDISATGTPVSLSDDQVSATIALGFEFPFYDAVHDSVRISSNGFLTFSDDGDSGCCSGRPIPSGDTPNAVVAGLWNDLNPSSGGSIHYTLQGTAPQRVFVVQFQNVPHFGSGLPVSMQFKLYEADGAIEVHYRDAPNDDSWFTAGIEDATGTIGLQYAHSLTALTTPLAVRYEMVPDLSVRQSAPARVVRSGDTLSFTLTVRNTHDVANDAVQLTDALPAGWSLVSATPSQGSCSASAPVVCALGSIPAGGTATVDVTVTTAGSGLLDNIASVSGSLVDTLTSNNTARMRFAMLPQVTPTLYALALDTPFEPTRLVTLQPSSGALVQEIGSTGLEALTALARAPGSSTLYAVQYVGGIGERRGSTVKADSGVPLFRIDATSAAATQIGLTGVESIDALTVAPDGSLLAAGWDVETSLLATLDTTTGDASALGTLDAGGNVNALAFVADGDLRLSDGERLWSVDPATAALSAPVVLQAPGAARGEPLTSMERMPGTDLVFVTLAPSQFGAPSLRDAKAAGQAMRAASKRLETSLLAVLDPASGEIIPAGSIPATVVTGIAFGDAVMPPPGTLTIAIGPASQQVPSGGTATFTVTVRNTGMTPLDTLAVEAPGAPDCARTLPALAAGGVWTYTCSLAGVTAPVSIAFGVTGAVAGSGGSVLASGSGSATVGLAAAIAPQATNIPAGSTWSLLLIGLLVAALGGALLRRP